MLSSIGFLVLSIGLLADAQVCRYCSLQTQACRLNHLCKAYIQTIGSISNPTDGMLSESNFVGHMSCSMQHCVTHTNCSVCQNETAACNNNISCATSFVVAQTGGDLSADDFAQPEFGALAFCFLDNCAQEEEYTCDDCTTEELACMESDTCVEAVKETASRLSKLPTADALKDETYGALISCEIKSNCLSALPCTACQDTYVNCLNDTTCSSIIDKATEGKTISSGEQGNTKYLAVLNCVSEKCGKNLNTNDDNATAVFSASGSGSFFSGSSGFLFSGVPITETDAPTTTFVPKSGSSHIIPQTFLIFGLVSFFLA
eukprot:m.315130 g.315130  ORF g.315130 m.315130 type:complete len:317 (+) comp16497_c0_seq1:100-1050(+)